MFGFGVVGLSVSLCIVWLEILILICWVFGSLCRVFLWLCLILVFLILKLGRWSSGLLLVVLFFRLLLLIGFI